MQSGNTCDAIGEHGNINDNVNGYGHVNCWRMTEQVLRIQAQKGGTLSVGVPPYAFIVLRVDGPAQRCACMIIS